MAWRAESEAPLHDLKKLELLAAFAEAQVLGCYKLEWLSWVNSGSSQALMRLGLVFSSYYTASGPLRPDATR